MHLKEALISAAHSMRNAPLRTALTAVGIAVGIASVVALIGFTTGLRNGFNATFGDLSRTVSITKGPPRVPGTSAVPLRESDAEALQENPIGSDIEMVTPTRTGSVVIRYRDQQFRGSLAGTGPGYLRLNDRTVVTGRMFTEQEADQRARVIVIGQRVVDTLFGGDDAAAVGSRVFAGRLSMKVVGVLTPVGQDKDNLNLMPLSTSRALLAGDDTLNGVGFMATTAAAVPMAVAQANLILDPLHKIKNIGERDYTAATNVAQLNQISTYISLIRWFTLTVASIALLIGAIGVANIMLITVSERTGEIGLRKAIGARRGAILRQFLLESLMLTAVGCLLGIGLGVGLVMLGGRLLPTMAPGYGVPELSWSAIFAALGVSLAIGVVAGGYPALRAARMHPIEALRY